MATLISFRVSDDLDKRLSILTEKTGHSRSYFLKKALEQFLEDREDYLLAIARLEEENPKISLEEVKQKLGLDKDD